MDIKLETPKQPEVVALNDLLDPNQLSLYPPESVYALDMNSLLQPNVLFAVARNLDGAAVACGAMVVTPEYGEVKRMFTLPEVRGKRVGSQLLHRLEQLARQKGITRLVLETGEAPGFEAAYRVYERGGFTVCGAVLDYPDSGFSRFYEKKILP